MIRSAEARAREFPDPRADESHCTGSGITEATRGAPEMHLNSQPPIPEREAQRREEEDYYKNKYGYYRGLQKKEDLLRRSESLRYNSRGEQMQ